MDASLSVSQELTVFNVTFTTAEDLSGDYRSLSSPLCSDTDDVRVFAAGRLVLSDDSIEFGREGQDRSSF